MSSGEGTIQGYAPTVVVGQGNPESVKYGKLWDMPQYREVSPGEDLVDTFLTQAQPRAGARCIDFGCGTGRAGYALAVHAGLDVTLVDFARNCLDPAVRDMLTALPERLRFVKADLEQPLPVTPAEYGYCTDVLEHVPPDRVGAVLDHILRAAKHVFFSISCGEDVCGALIGEPLHLTIQPPAWWLEQLRLRGCVIHWTHSNQRGVLVYCTLWQEAQVVVECGTVNTPEAEVYANVTHNVAQGWQQVVPCPTQETEVMLVGGAPSLAGFLDEIRERREQGVKLVTLNGAYTWALEHGLTPSATIVVDARPFNARFTHPVVDACKYLIASQVHPSVLEGLPQDRTYLWHGSGPGIHDILQATYETSYPVPGGGTVLLRAIPLLRMLGYHRFHLYGCDSCLSAGAHHAYAQPENDDAAILPIMVTGGRVFYCHPWMVSQAREFITLVQKMGETFECQIHGDGLLAHILETGAEIAPPQDEGED